MNLLILFGFVRGTWLLVFLAAISTAAAREGAARTREAASEHRSLDKRAYFLFHRTPSELRRDLAADRPDSTETPITVDAGWFQVESSFFDYGRNDDGGIKEETLAVFSGGVTFAVSDDVQFDVGGRVGLNDAAEDGGVFSGITFRF